jgi:hypothetical protein
MSKGSCRGGALRRTLFILPLAAIAVRCQLLAGIEDIAYTPGDASAGVAQGSSGSSQTPDDGGASDTQSSGSTASGASAGTTSGASGAVSPSSGVAAGGSTSGVTSGGAESGSTSGSAAGGMSGGSAGATSGTVMPSSGVATGGSTSGVTSSGSKTGSSGSGSSAGSASGSSSGTGGADGGPKCRSNQLSPVAAVASSVEGQTDATAGLLVAADAIDGNFATRWGSVFMADPQWIYVDFGAPVFVDEVDILWQSACASAYDIDVSSDATNWTLVKAVTGAPPTWAAAPPGWTNDAGMPTADVHKGLSGLGRYLRINGTARCLALYGYSIWEMRAIGDTNASCSP